MYSGGGIDPDKRIAGPVEGFNPGRFGRLLYNRQEFENYAVSLIPQTDPERTRMIRSSRWNSQADLKLTNIPPAPKGVAPRGVSLLRVSRTNGKTSLIVKVVV